LKYWNQDDLWNGKYTIADFFDILDAILEEEERKMKIDAALHGIQL
jgi:hypothetical protein